MKAGEKLLAELRAGIPEIEPLAAVEAIAAGARLVDVRDVNEWGEGCVPDALRLPRGQLELRIEEQIPDINCCVILACSGGTRSLLAAANLQRMGYSGVHSLRGGLNAWKQAGLPWGSAEAGGLDAYDRARYSRHLVLPEVGERGQRALLDARVLLVGAGGLGAPLALYLSAAGVGTLGLVDDDRVELSNLQRQVAHAEPRLGMLKTDSARAAVSALNARCRVETHPVRLDSSNVESILDGYQIVVDGSDNFPTRYLLNDACVKLGKPLVYGAVHRFDGQASVFWPASKPGIAPCYRCLFPAPPAAEDAPNCAQAGVLGVLPGLVGLIQATETLKWILGAGDLLVGRLLTLDALGMHFRELRLSADPQCPVCAPGRPFPGYIDYAQFCSA